jgi:hypothetical protein
MSLSVAGQPGVSAPPLDIAAMTDTNFPLTADSDMSDLPRTLRREHEARARAASGFSAEQASYASAPDSSYAQASAAEPYPAAVRRFEVPFGHLVGFFLKAVLAAIPALILLTALLWGFGQVLKIFFPELLQMQIVVSFPKT